MGNEIVYCARCQDRLIAAEFESGKALWSGDKPYCDECLMGLLATLPPKEEKRILEQLAVKRAGREAPAPPPPGPPRNPPPRKTSTARIPIVKKTDRIPIVRKTDILVKTDRKLAAVPPAAGPKPAAFIVLGAVVVLVLAALASGGRTERPDRRADPPPAALDLVVERPPPPPPPPPAVERHEVNARQALEKARDYGKSNPNDFPGRIARYEEAAWECRGTDLAAIARREHEALQQERGAYIAVQLAPAAAAAEAAAARNRYGDAIAALEKDRARLAGTDWTSAVDQKILQVRQRADQAFAACREKTLDARRRGAEDVVQACVAKVKDWGLEDFSAQLKAALDATPPPAPGESSEARAWQAAWEKAFPLARARDYDAALKVLGPKTDPDLDLLRALAAAHADALQTLARTPKGQKLEVEVEGPLRLEGTVTRTTPGGLELRTEAGTVQVDFDSLTAAALRDLMAKADARVVALFLLLEGETATTPLSARFTAFGARAAALAPQEAEARARFETAEREFADPVAKLGAFDRYRALLASHGETAFVARKHALLAQRLESEKDAGKEYFFFADQMRGAGGFRRLTHPKAPVCWTSTADGPEAETSVEFSFGAKAGLEYRCWVYVGACCAETFAFSAQATEQAAAEAVKNTIPFLKKTHALHGGRKEASRFEWIPVPLPRFATGGAKTVRLLSGQQGFTVGYALVSAARPAPPADTVIKEWVWARPSPAAASPTDAALAAWWALDDGSGAVAVDASPSGLTGTLRNDPVWTSGRRKGALSFDGRDDYVEVPRSPRLYFKGAFTVAAWVNVAELPRNEFGMYVVSDYTAVGDRCTMSLRVLPSGAAQFFWQEAEQRPTQMATSPARVLPGTWVHLAGVWDGSMRTIYVNGAADGSNGAPQARPDQRGSLSIGRPGSFNGLYFRGRIDDVRLYDRALTLPELQKLAR